MLTSGTRLTAIEEIPVNYIGSFWQLAKNTGPRSGIQPFRAAGAGRLASTHF